jgi:leucyl aminopeptidase
VKIELVPILQADLDNALVCRFHEQGRHYGMSAGPDLPADRQLTLRHHDGQLALAINIDAFKNFERGEARRVAAAASLRQAQAAGLTRVVWLLDGPDFDVQTLREFVSGALLYSYRFDAYKARPKTAKPELELTIAIGKGGANLRRELPRLEAINRGVARARDLANMPANDLTPEQLAATAKQVASAMGLKFTQISAKQLAAQKFVGLTMVGQGSAHPPVLFTLSYTPERSKRRARPLCLVGKGLTFDSGGLSIKPWEGMWDMKGDMGGAAAVIGAMQAIAELQLPVEVIGVVAAAENMPDGAAYRPGDILRYKNGKTVEIHSTDAEGRLVLADALLYSQDNLSQQRIVEYSTLTGACARALGQQYIGLMSRSPLLAEQVKQAATLSGENVWELPLHPEYRSQLDSSSADMKNVGGPLAGAQTAGWFLHEFIREGTQYVHLDIAGAFLADKENKYWGQAGATGAGVRLSVALAELSAG